MDSLNYFYYAGSNRLKFISETRLQLKPKEEELFTGNLHNTIYSLVQELQGINPVTNALHIRGSVIINWLK